MINKKFASMIIPLQKFIAERDWEQFHNHKDMAEALIVEAAELLEIFRFKKVEELDEYIKDPVIREELSDELSDVMWYVLELSENMGIDLEKAMLHKLQKTALKYPVAKAKGKNLKYTKL